MAELAQPGAHDRSAEVAVGFGANEVVERDWHGPGRRDIGLRAQRRREVVTARDLVLGAVVAQQQAVLHTGNGWQPVALRCVLGLLRPEVQGQRAVLAVLQRRMAVEHEAIERVGQHAEGLRVRRRHRPVVLDLFVWQLVGSEGQRVGPLA
ncbi:hypothetical protein D3C76_1112580 [compost metagenome]